MRRPTPPSARPDAPARKPCRAHRRTVGRFRLLPSEAGQCRCSTRRVSGQQRPAPRELIDAVPAWPAASLRALAEAGPLA